MDTDFDKNNSTFYKIRNKEICYFNIWKFPKHLFFKSLVTRPMARFLNLSISATCLEGRGSLTFRFLAEKEFSLINSVDFIQMGWAVEMRRTWTSLNIQRISAMSY